MRCAQVSVRVLSSWLLIIVLRMAGILSRISRPQYRFPNNGCRSGEVSIARIQGTAVARVTEQYHHMALYDPIGIAPLPKDKGEERAENILKRDSN
jgi:hypothetical protein